MEGRGGNNGAASGSHWNGRMGCVQLNVSSEIAGLMERAVALSVRQGHFFVGVEHLFAAILEEPSKLPRPVEEAFLNKLFAALREMNRYAWRGNVQHPGGEVFHTPRAIGVTQQAGRLAERLGRGPAQYGHMLLAIVGDAMSAPSRAMDALQLDRQGMISALQQELGKQAAARPLGAAAPAAREQRGTGAAQAQAQPQAHRGVEAALDDGQAAAQAAADNLVRDLTELARRGGLEAAIGRRDEFFQILQILTRKTKNNVMLVGEAGVGKTQIVEGLALKVAQGELAGHAPNFRILELNMAALMSGTQYRGAFEEKILALLERLKQTDDAVLFIDEVHLIMGAGSTDDGSMDLANLLKPALARGEIRCIGATTIKEYRKFVEKDPAIERRFQMVRVEELDSAATMEVLKKLRPSLEAHHKVKISSRALEAAIALTDRYMPNRHFPDKAIDMLDQACSRYRLKLHAFKSDPGFVDSNLSMIAPGTEEKVTPHDIRKVVSQATSIPIEEMTAHDRLQLQNLDKKLKEKIIGQDEAVTRVVAAVKKSRAGLSDPNRPDAAMLFLGPTGVGKTQLAKYLADYLFGSRNHLLTFDMSEFIEEHSVAKLIGAPPGYVGSDEEGRLTSAVANSPFSIVLFDEIEKAHPRIFDIFLPILDEGRLKDSKGRDVSFKNCIIIMTSNIGASLLSRQDDGSAGRALVQELRKHFRPEFINRVDEIVPFFPLLAEDVRTILRLEVNKVRYRLREKKLSIRMYQQAYEFLAKQGYNPEFGGRELRRTVDRHLTTPISAMIMDNVFQPGDVIEVLMENGELLIRRGVPEPAAQVAS